MKNELNRKTEIAGSSPVWNIKIRLMATETSDNSFYTENKLLRLQVVLN